MQTPFSGDLRFILLVIPIPKTSMETDYYVRELLIFVKSLIPIEIVLLDRRDKATYKISTYIAILPDYKGFDWVFATNIKYEKISRYVRYYKKRWGIETTFRVQDEVKTRFTKR